MEELNLSNIQSQFSEQITKFKNYLMNFSNGKADKLCIFCAGEYGIQLYHELRNRLISVHFFADNNSSRWGYLLENIECISPKQLEVYKQNTLIIVANRDPSAIVCQLKKSGYPYVVTKQEIDKVLSEVPRIKWMTSLENIENIDYSSKDVIVMMQFLNQTIFDICKYYEDRLKKNGD